MTMQWLEGELGKTGNKQDERFAKQIGIIREVRGDVPLPVTPVEAPRVEVARFSPEAREIMGEEFFGPDEIENAFGFGIDRSLIPEIPFSTRELVEARMNDCYLMLYVPKKSDGTNITAQGLVDALQEQFEHDGKGKIQSRQTLHHSKDLSVESLFTTDTPRNAWRLITKDVIPGSLRRNYLQQTEAIVKYLTGTVFKGRDVPADYQEAIDEFEREKNDLRINLLSKREESANILVGLKLTQMTRQTFVEERYAWIVYFQNRNKRLLEKNFTCTGSQTSDNRLILVGETDAGGADVTHWPPDESWPGVGVVFSR